MRCQRRRELGGRFATTRSRQLGCRERNRHSDRQQRCRKSTTLMTICGVLKPTEGNITFEGRAIEGLPSYQIARLGLVQVPEGRRILRGLTVTENLDLGGFYRTAEERRGSAAQDLRTSSAPRGAAQTAWRDAVRRRAADARNRARIDGWPADSDLFDEPFLGLAPLIVEQIFELISDLRRAGTTILLVEQNAAMALEIADRGYVLETGRIAASGSAISLRQDDGVRRAYLGFSA